MACRGKAAIPVWRRDIVTRNRLSRGLFIAVALVGVLAVMGFGLPLVPADIRGLAVIPVFVLFYAIILIYWRGIDEAAREAQKSAWLWGGAVGMTVAVVPAMFAAQHVAPWARNWLMLGQGSPEERAFVAGILYVVLAQALGFFLFWAVWWLRASASGRNGVR